MDDEIFDSITWETSSTMHRPPLQQGLHQGVVEYDPHSTVSEPDDPLAPRWEGYLLPSVRDPVKELPDTRDTYVSYLVSAKVCLSLTSIASS